MCWYFKIWRLVKERSILPYNLISKWFPYILPSSVGLQDIQLQKTLPLQNVWWFNSAFHQDKNIFIYDTLVDAPTEEKAHIGGKDSYREGKRKEEISWLTKQCVSQKKNSVCFHQVPWFRICPPNNVPSSLIGLLLDIFVWVHSRNFWKNARALHFA